MPLDSHCACVRVSKPLGVLVLFIYHSKTSYICFFTALSLKHKSPLKISVLGSSASAGKLFLVANGGNDCELYVLSCEAFCVCLFFAVMALMYRCCLDDFAYFPVKQ